MKKFLSLFMALVMVISLAACGTNNDEGAGEQKDGEKKVEKITMGFIPSQEADKIADTVEPLEAYLTEQLGIPVEAEVMIDFVGLVEGMRTGKIDIGFINPFGYVQAVERAEVEIILKSIRHGSDTYTAQFIAPADSNLKTVDDIVNTEGLTWAYSDPLSTSGYLFPAALLMDKGVANLDEHYQKIAVGGHDNAVLAVLDGQADFATTFNDARSVVKEEYPDVMEKIKVIGYTEEIPNDGIAVRKGLSPEMVEEIKAAFLAINDNEEVLKVMNEVYTWDGIAEAKDEEFDVVRGVYEKFKSELE